MDSKNGSTLVCGTMVAKLSTTINKIFCCVNMLSTVCLSKADVNIISCAIT